MNIEELNTLVTRISGLRILINDLTSKLDEYKTQKELLHSELIKVMKDNELRSWKTNDSSYSLVSKYDIKILDEDVLINEINTRQLNGLIFMKVDTTRFKQVANLILKETGEVIPGTECIKQEYISIKSIT